MNNYLEYMKEIKERFPTEKACRDYLHQVRWGKDFRCPECNSKHYTVMKNGNYRCKGEQCRKIVSIRNGTLLHGSRKPLVFWVRGMWWVLHQEEGIQPSYLQQELGFGNSEKASKWLRKVRKTMVVPKLKSLSERIQMKVINIYERKSQKPTIIAFAVEDRRVTSLLKESDSPLDYIGEIRIELLNKNTSKTVTKFLEKNIKNRLVTNINGQWSHLSSIDTDGFKVDNKWLQYNRVVAWKVNEPFLMLVNDVITRLKKSIIGIHKGAVKRGYLQDYINEFTFRINYRNDKIKALEIMLKNAMATKPL